MNINDILKQERFQNFDQFLTQQMYDYAGDDLVKKMIDVLDTEDYARDWFYSSLKSLGGKRPYDYCKKGDISEVEDILGRIEHGIY